MMRGVLEFLTSDSPFAHKLRAQFVFYLLPMLNPDGVVLGNYRCSSVGLDLNRQYSNPKEATSPEVLALKTLAESVPCAPSLWPERRFAAEAESQGVL